MNILTRLLSGALLLAAPASMAKADSLVASCGPIVRSAVRTTTAPFTFTLESYVDVPNSAFVVNVPAGKTQCVILTFSASARCPHACFVRAIGTTIGLDPDAPSNRFAQGEVHGAHTFQWAKRVSPGTETIRIQITRGNTLDDADIGPYTTRLEVRE